MKLNQNVYSMKIYFGEIFISVLKSLFKIYRSLLLMISLFPLLTIQHFFRFLDLEIHLFFRFAAEIRGSWYAVEELPYGDITGFTEFIDIGNNFDPHTGRLTIKDIQQSGLYTFHISAWKMYMHGKEGEIKVYKNEEDVQHIYENDAEHSLMMNSVFTLRLFKGDEVKLGNVYDESIYVSSLIPFTFTGYKITGYEI